MNGLGWALVGMVVLALGVVAVVPGAVRQGMSEGRARVVAARPTPCHAELTARTETECHTKLSGRAKVEAYALCDRLHGKTSFSYDEISCWSADPYEDGSWKLFVYTLAQAQADDAADVDGGAP